jgi:hypothetical protein
MVIESFSLWEIPIGTRKRIAQVPGRQDMLAFIPLSCTFLLTRIRSNMHEGYNQTERNITISARSSLAFWKPLILVFHQLAV